MADNADTKPDEFIPFFASRLRPELDRVIARRRAWMWRSIAAGAGAFLLLFIVMYLMLSPYYKMLGENDVSYWPLLFLLPATFGVILFSVSYILSLRSIVRKFRETLLARTAEYIDPAMVYRTDASISESQLRQSLLFDNLGKPSAGSDVFSARRGNTECELAELRVERKDRKRLCGVYFSAKFDRRFPAVLVVLTATEPAGIGGMAEKIAALNVPHADELVRLEVPGYPLQILTRSRDQESAPRVLSAVFTPELLNHCTRRGFDPYLSCLGDRLTVVFLQNCGSGNDEDKALADLFDINACRDFCDDAAACLAISDHVSREFAVWEGWVN